jgi:ferritin
MDSKLQDLIQEQIGHEYYSSYLYLQMASYFESENLDGFAQWMKVQTREEREHGDKMFEFLQDRGVRVILRALPQPPSAFASAQDVFEKTLEHERKVTSLIHGIADYADKVNDRPTKAFIQWFVTEQVEEEKNATEIIALLKMAGDNKGALIMLDKDMAARTFVPPPGMTTL